MAKDKDPKQLIFEQLREKGCLKQKIFRSTIKNFKRFKEAAADLTDDLNTRIQEIDQHVEVKYMDETAYHFKVKFAGDVLVFHMHTNVFNFDNSHQIWKSSYVKEDESRAYCGMINVYNFLADSLKYQRQNDLGYLVARIFVNKDNHFFVEGKRQLGFLYNNFSTDQLTPSRVTDILESAILYAMDFDLLSPPYDAMKEITVYQLTEIASSTSVSTGKRLGFKFQADTDI